MVAAKVGSDMATAAVMAAALMASEAAMGAAITAETVAE